MKSKADDSVTAKDFIMDQMPVPVWPKNKALAADAMKAVGLLADLGLQVTGTRGNRRGTYMAFFKIRDRKDWLDGIFSVHDKQYRFPFEIMVYNHRGQAHFGTDGRDLDSLFRKLGASKMYAKHKEFIREEEKAYDFEAALLQKMNAEQREAYLRERELDHLMHGPQ